MGELMNRSFQKERGKRGFSETDSIEHVNPSFVISFPQDLEKSPPKSLATNP